MKATTLGLCVGHLGNGPPLVWRYPDLPTSKLEGPEMGSKLPECTQQRVAKLLEGRARLLVRRVASLQEGRGAGVLQV